MQRFAKEFDLSSKHIEKARKDFLVLMQNVRKGQINTGQNFIDFFYVIDKWHAKQQHFKTYLERELRLTRGGLLDDYKEDVAAGAKGTQLLNKYKYLESADWFWKNISIFDKFLTHVHDYILDTHGVAMLIKMYKKDMNIDHLIQETHIQKALVKWDKKCKALARKAWDYLYRIKDWANAGDNIIILENRSSEIVNLEGFRVEIIAYDPQRDHNSIAYLKDVLKTYRKNSLKVFPWLIQHHIPIKLDFNSNLGLASAIYNVGEKHIEVATSQIKKIDKNRFVWVLAHEMGHHTYRNYLSKDQKDLWARVIDGDYKRLDLRDVLKAYGDLDSKAFKRDHYIMYLQMSALYHGKGKLILNTKDRIQEYLDSGGGPVIKVPANPISGYSATNPEEAFCEALWLLVAYGPKALLGPIKELMHIMMPEIRISSRRTSSQIFELSQGCL